MNKVIELTKGFVIILAWLGVAFVALGFWGIFSDGEVLASLSLAVYGIFLVYMINTVKRTN